MKNQVIHVFLTIVLWGLTTDGYSQWGNCGPLSGPSGICAGNSAQYVGNAIQGASYYQWVIYGANNGTGFSSYQTSTPTNTLNVGANQTPGTVSWDVRAYNSGSVQIGACYGAVTVYSAAPTTPTDISWTGDLCIEQAKTYTCTSVSASSYMWEVTEISFSRTTPSNSIYLEGNNFSSSGDYTLRVKAVNSCGESGWRSETITVVSGCDEY